MVRKPIIIIRTAHTSSSTMSTTNYAIVTEKNSVRYTTWKLSKSWQRSKKLQPGQMDYRTGFLERMRSLSANHLPIF